MKYVKLFFMVFLMVSVFACTKEKKQASTSGTGDVAETVAHTKFGTPIEFKSCDLNGNKIGSEVFQNADVTLVNIWATWCGPCRGELPALGKIAEKYTAKGYQVIGFILDVSEGSDNADVAKEILSDAGCNFPVVMNHPSLDAVFADVDAFPTTLFVDKAGNLLLPEHIGATDEKGFEALFEKAIEAAK